MSEGVLFLKLLEGLIAGFDSSFLSAVVKIYPFASLYWVDNDENT